MVRPARREVFVFLGCTIRKRRSIQRNPRWHFMERWPGSKATPKLPGAGVDRQAAKRERCEATCRGTDARASWLGNYFRTGNADREFNKMDNFVVRSLLRWQYRRDQLYGMGLYKLMSTVKYPAQATPARSSVSRVRENRTHGCVSSEGWRVQWENRPTEVGRHSHRKRGATDRLNLRGNRRQSLTLQKGGV
jgi:hypothetical protein